MNKTRNFINIFLVFLLSACATTLVEEKVIVKPLTPVLQKEREVKAFEKFNEILKVSRSSKNRTEVRPKLEDLYTQLIEDFPEVPLAQESYWKLIEIYVNEYSPTAYEKAEEIYSKFQENYPQSAARVFLVKTLSFSYYKNKKWEQLLKITEPVFKGYLDGKDPLWVPLIFMYAESNFWLNNYTDAEKAFEILLEKFPQFKDNKLAEARIIYIQRNR